MKNGDMINFIGHANELKSFVKVSSFFIPSKDHECYYWIKF